MYDAWHTTSRSRKETPLVFKYRYEQESFFVTKLNKLMPALLQAANFSSFLGTKMGCFIWLVFWHMWQTCRLSIMPQFIWGQPKMSLVPPEIFQSLNNPHVVFKYVFCKHLGITHHPLSRKRKKKKNYWEVSLSVTLGAEEMLIVAFHVAANNFDCLLPVVILSCTMAAPAHTVSELRQRCHQTECGQNPVIDFPKGSALRERQCFCLCSVIFISWKVPW